MDFSKILDSKICETREENIKLCICMLYICAQKSTTSSEASLKKSTGQFTVTSKNGFSSDWEIGYKMVNHDSYTLYLKLKSSDYGVNYALKPVKWTLNRFNEGRPGWHLISEYQVENASPLREAKAFTNPGLRFLLNDRNEQAGSVWWQSRLYVQIKKIPYDSMEEFKPVATKTHQNNMANLLNKSESADLKIICSDGVQLSAHKLILSAQCPLFATMLTADMKEKSTGVVQVQDIGSSVMRILLHYLYSGDLQEDWSEQENIVEFTYAAGKYQLTDVLNLLDKALGNIDHGNETAALFSLANKLGLEKAESSLLEAAREQVGKMKTSKDLVEMFEKLTH